MTEVKSERPNVQLSAPEALRQLVQRAEQGDLTVLPLLRAALDEEPKLWRHYGDLSLQAQASLVKLVGGTNLLLTESLVRKLAELKTELAGSSPSPLEQLLVDRVVACWLQVAYADALFAQVRDVPVAQGAELQRRQDAAHRRYLQALKTLATVRRFLPPERPLALAPAPHAGNGRYVHPRCTRSAVRDGEPILN
jgi:hypothetical protein